MDTVVYVKKVDPEPGRELTSHLAHKKVDGGWLVWGDYTDPEHYCLEHTLAYRLACVDYVRGKRKEFVHDECWELFIPDADVVKVTQEVYRYGGEPREWAGIWPPNPEQVKIIDALVAQYELEQ